MSWQNWSSGNGILTSKRKSSSVAYSANGLILRQTEVVTETRWRGLTQNQAESKVTGSGSLMSDGTTTTLYYKQIGSSNDYAVVGIITGTKVDVVASRANDADGWELVKTETTYSDGSATGWSTTRPAATSNGVEISRDKRSSFVYCEEGDTLYAEEETVVTEYRYLTQSEAATKVSNLTTNSANYTRVWHAGVAMTGRDVVVGTSSSASSRYVDAEHGYTVTQTSVTHSYSGTNWSHT